MDPSLPQRTRSFSPLPSSREPSPNQSPRGRETDPLLSGAQRAATMQAPSRTPLSPSPSSSLDLANISRKDALVQATMQRTVTVPNTIKALSAGSLPIPTCLTPLKALMASLFPSLFDPAEGKPNPEALLETLFSKLSKTHTWTTEKTSDVFAFFKKNAQFFPCHTAPVLVGVTGLDQKKLSDLGKVFAFGYPLTKLRTRGNDKANTSKIVREFLSDIGANDGVDTPKMAYEFLSQDIAARVPAHRAFRGRTFLTALIQDNIRPFLKLIKPEQIQGAFGAQSTLCTRRT